MLPPTTSQQNGLAYAQMPFAFLSFLSSLYVIHHISYKQSHKLKRLYHRLVLALNIAVVPLSLVYMLGSFMVPEGTEYYVAARGNVQSCTAGGKCYAFIRHTVMSSASISCTCHSLTFPHLVVPRRSIPIPRKKDS